MGKKTVAKFGSLTDIADMFEIMDLLRIADAYGCAVGVGEKTVSGRVFSDSKKLGALRTGADLTTARFKEAVHWFSDNWPENGAWPKGGIPRPDPRPVVEAAE